MSKPKAYSPEYGYEFQILTRYNSKEWEHLDYARNRKELKQLLADNRQSAPYMQYKTIQLPNKYWLKYWMVTVFHNQKLNQYYTIKHRVWHNIEVPFEDKEDWRIHFQDGLDVYINNYGCEPEHQSYFKE